MRIKISSKLAILSLLLLTLFPVSYYYIKSEFHSLDNDAAAMKRLSFITGSIQRLVRTDTYSPQQSNDIDSALASLEKIYITNPQNTEVFSETNFLEDYRQFLHYWESMKRALETNQTESLDRLSETCWLYSNKILFHVQFISEQKQAALADAVFFTTLVSSMLALLLLLFILYHVRGALEKTALYDPLTHLFNERYFREELLRQCELGKRNDLPLSMMMIDAKGDEKSVKSAAEVLGGMTRASDTLFYLEKALFAIIAPNLDDGGLQGFINRFEDALREKPWKLAAMQHDPDETPQAFEMKVKRLLDGEPEV